MARKPETIETVPVEPLRALLAAARLVESVARMEPGWRREELAEDAAWTLRAVHRAGSFGDHLTPPRVDSLAVISAIELFSEANLLGELLDSGASRDPPEVECSRARLVVAIDTLAAAIEVVEAVRRLPEDQRGEIHEAPRPVSCSQADVARFVGRSVNTSRLLHKLSEEGRIEWLPTGNRTRHRVRFLDPDEHARFAREFHAT